MMNDKRWRCARRTLMAAVLVALCPGVAVLGSAHLAVTITGAAPSSWLNGSIGLCFKPDGRVLQTDTERPVIATNSDYAAGEAWLDLQRLSLNNGGIGKTHRIVIPYNGVPRRDYP